MENIFAFLLLAMNRMILCSLFSITGSHYSEVLLWSLMYVLELRVKNILYTTLCNQC